MSSTALIPAPSTEILVGGRSFADIAPLELIPAPLKQSTDALIERSEVLETIGNTIAEEAGARLLKELSTFIKTQTQACEVEVAPFKAAIVKRQTARDLLLQAVEAEKERVKGLLEAFGKVQALKREQERKAQEAETARLKSEAEALTREKERLEQERLRKIQEEEARIAREKREAEAKAERERQAAAAEQERLKREREAAERAGTAADMENARKAEAEAKAKAEAEEKARVEAQAKADREYQEEKARNEAAAKAKEAEFSLRQAELNTQASEASKSSITSKPAGISGSFKWRAKAADESSPEAIQACMAKAFAVKPDWFDLVPKLRVIEAALKEADGKMEVPGLIFDKTYAVKTR